jgi:hypothetical protein
MTSADSKNRAACTAKRIIRIAPMLKLGAISTPTPGGPSASQPRTSSSRSSVNPVVPTTACIPATMHACRFPSTASGWVKSTAT